MMTLRDLLKTITNELPPNHTQSLDVPITQQCVHYDSRQVKPGDIFVAIPGLQVDGHDFIGHAVQAGATVVVGQRTDAVAAIDNQRVTSIVVDNSAEALGILSHQLYGDPTSTMGLVGVTGTNGKTTTTYLVAAMVKAWGKNPGVIGTVGVTYNDHIEAASFTTPMSPELAGVFSRMRAAACSHAVMEVSSHALDFGRVWGCRFAVGAFTHLTQDHLDLHGDMSRYLAAKLRLFEAHVVSNGYAVVNLDGACGREVVTHVSRVRPDIHIIGVTCADNAPVMDVPLYRLIHLRQLEFGVAGITGAICVEAQTQAFCSPLLGNYNAENIAVAVGCAVALGVPLTDVSRGLKTMQGVPGRLERVDGAHHHTKPAVLVDYAHTPDALARAIAVLRPLCEKRLIVVFGCGGDRDRKKRPLMGQAVAQLADIAIVTSDNPRTEAPDTIIEDILPGVSGGTLAKASSLDQQSNKAYYVQSDRRLAINAAIRCATTGDIVLIAGKGHEDYQIIGKQKFHFDDREVAREALSAAD